MAMAVGVEVEMGTARHGCSLAVARRHTATLAISTVRITYRDLLYAYGGPTREKGTLRNHRGGDCRKQRPAPALGRGQTRRGLGFSEPRRLEEGLPESETQSSEDRVLAGWYRCL